MVESYRNRIYNFSTKEDYTHTGNENSNHTIDEMKLNEWELRILATLKSSSKTEKRICKEVKLNASIVSELVTDLIEKGLISSHRKRRMHIYSSEYFSATLYALKILQDYAHHQRRNEDGILEQILAFATYWFRQIRSDFCNTS